jgi:hypothetical protein
MMEAEPRSFTTTSIDEAIWTGSARRIDLEALLDGDLGVHTALEQILLAIIDAHPDERLTGHARTPKVKNARRFRLEQALKPLIGATPPRGQIKKEYETGLERIAKRFLSAALGSSDSRTTLREIIVTEIVSDEDRATLDHKQIDNRIRGYLREFNRHKDRLLVKVSATGLPEVEERDRKIGLVIELLGELGIIRALKS